MVPEKRKLMVIGAAIAAAFALPGCAPAGYNADDYNSASDAQQVSQPTDDPAGEPTAEPTDVPEDDGEDPGDDPNLGGADPADDTSGDQGGSGGEKAGGDQGEDPIVVADNKVTGTLKAVKVARMGSTVQDQNGWVLYRFDSDKAKPSSKSECNGDCAKVWPPALTNDGKPDLAGVDESLVGTVVRADGTRQLTLKGWPLYRYIGDRKPGAWKGQNVGGKWFVASPDGTKNLTCLPKPSKPVAPPSDDGNDSGTDLSY